MARYSWINFGAMTMVALAAACSSAGKATSNGAGGAAVASSSVTTGSATSSSVATGSAGVGGAGGGSGTCDPPADPGTFYAQAANYYGAIDPVSMCNYRGDVILVVNTAAV